MPPRIDIILVAAMGANRVIGNGPQIPWRIPGEQRRFRELTEGKVIAVGRKTHEAIGRALPNRTTIVISRQTGYQAVSCIVVPSLAVAIEIASRLGDTLYVAGGAEIYALAVSFASQLVLTEIQRDFTGDVYFPVIDPAQFACVQREDVTASIPYCVARYQRVAPVPSEQDRTALMPEPRTAT